jgi:chemotaxis family two-component system sensor kinase Cph1
VSNTAAATDLTSCDRERIEIPGAIQPYGMMLVSDLQTLLVRQIAGNVTQRLNVSNWDGSSLEVFIGEELFCDLTNRLRTDPSGGFIGKLLVPGGETLDVSAHVSGAWLIVELEPASAVTASAPQVLIRLDALMARFDRADTLVALCNQAAAAFRDLGGYDRAVVLRFSEDNTCNVLAEDRHDDVRSFLHQRFPATDIPRQARALCLRNPVRVIPDITYVPAPLLPVMSSPNPLDLSDSSLRSVSSSHLQYLANMGVRATASVSLINDGLLWGLIVCHNMTPKLMPYDVRAAYRALAGALVQRIRIHDQAEEHHRWVRLRDIGDTLLALLSRDGFDSLSQHIDIVGRVVESDGVAVVHADRLMVSGHCPNSDAIRELSTWIVARDSGTVFATNRLPALYPAAETYQDCASGVLAVCPSTEEPWLLLWFRGEEIETVNWAGNPYSSGNPDGGGPIIPRTSFEAWAETVRGHARPWSPAEVDAAARLRAALQDATQKAELSKVNASLASANHILAATLEHMRQGVCFFGGDEKLILCNRQYTDMYELPPSAGRPGTTLLEIAAHRLAKGSSPDMSPEGYLQWRGTLSRPGKAFYSEVILRNGTIILIYHYPMPDGGWVATHEDITERRRTEEMLGQAQKLAAVGRLTAGIAHDFNNLLQTIGAALEIASTTDDVRADTKLLAVVEDAMMAVESGGKLTQQLLTFSRQQRLDKVSVDVGELIKGFSGIFRQACGEGIEFTLLAVGGPFLCLTDIDQLRSALLNLVINARDAMSFQGTLSIHVDTIAIVGDVAVSADVSVGTYIRVEVRDTGRGITLENLALVFEPFFTTKPFGMGSGLGLAQVHGFAHQSGGSVSIASTVGKGTTVTLLLPHAGGRYPTVIGPS